ncbi:DoxX family membrane protein [Streptosporangium sp. NPDC048047]|uniref:DoxX family protein n=1 Tax=Streptosporangium sp. NPDC048047 TaxID=3155748 RepID=UPI0034336CCF
MRRSLYDVAALIARIVVGVVFVAHGWQKLTGGGAGATAAQFAGMGVPLPEASAWYAIVVELIGGILLILGLLTPLAGLLLAIDMLGAVLFVHRRALFVGEGGFELAGALGSAALLLAAGGAGRISLDHLFFGRRRERRRRDEAGLPYVPPLAAEPRQPAPADRSPDQPAAPADRSPEGSPGLPESSPGQPPASAGGSGPPRGDTTGH